MPWVVPHPNWRFTVLLAADLLLIFLVAPLLSRDDLPQIVGPMTTLLVTAGTIALVSDRRAVQVGILAVVLLAAAVQLLPDQLSDRATLAGQAGCAVLITVFVGRAVFFRGEVDAHRVAGGIALYLNVGLAFAAAYVLLSDISPTAFEGLQHDRALRMDEMVHFSLSTLTTLGYGDILPRSPAARSLADLEAVIGQLFPATLLARLIGLLIRRH